MINFNFKIAKSQVRNTIWCSSVIKNFPSGVSFLLLGAFTLIFGCRNNGQNNISESRTVDPFSGEALYQHIETYVSLGEHRTASEGDLRTADWIQRVLEGAGLQVTTQYFTLNQFFIHQLRLDVNGNTIDCFPVWPPVVTVPDPIQAKAAFIKSDLPTASFDGKIIVLQQPTEHGGGLKLKTELVELINSAAANGARAVIVVTKTVSQELAAYNSQTAVQLFSVPVVTIGQRDLPQIKMAVQNRSEVSLLLTGSYQTVQAKNVIGRIDHGGKWGVISTPYSGWFHCGGERGPGLAVFLALARAAAEDSTASFLFVATTGHELGGLGMQRFLEKRAPKPDMVKYWLHLGAGLATFRWQSLPAGGLQRLNKVDEDRYLIYTSKFEHAVRQSFRNVTVQHHVAERIPIGELRLVSEMNYRPLLTMTAAHSLHHTKRDSQQTTGPELLQPVGRAFRQLLETLSTTSLLGQSSIP